MKKMWKRNRMIALGMLCVVSMWMSGCGKEKEASTDTPEAAGQQVEVDEVVEDTNTDSMEALQFQTVSLDGDAVTQDIFSDYDVTVIHVWGTFSDPCVKEMKDYAKFYKSLPEKTNLIGIVFDVYAGSDDYVDDAKKILSDAGAEFTNLRMGGALEDLLYDIQDVPATIYVDSKGNVLGEVLEGAALPDVEKQLKEYLK